MGSIFRKTAVRDVPASAKIVISPDGSEKATWVPRGSRRPVTAPVVTLGAGRRVVEVPTGNYYAKYRDHDGIVRTVSTHCRDESAARQVLSRLEKNAERVTIGVATAAELKTADHTASPVAKHISDYVATLTGSASHRENTERYLRRLADDLGWQRLTDVRRDDLELWLAGQTRQGRSARSRNAFKIAASSFCKWCARAKRMSVNPFAGDPIPSAKEDADRRRQRRALTLDELRGLICAARNAPERPPTRRRDGNEQNAGRPAQRLTGSERGEVYAILAGTGLRIGELEQLRVADIRLADRVPHIELPARITKNSEDACIPLRSDLVALLRRRVEGRALGSPLYAIPRDFIKRFNADCRRAGIPKRDERGRTVDIHVLRTTFASWLAAVGVDPRTAQELMRHKDINLTAGVYTDPKLLDTAAAVESLPSVVPVSSCQSSTNRCRLPSFPVTSWHPGSPKRPVVNPWDKRKNPALGRVFRQLGI
jgi:integrase